MKRLVLIIAVGSLLAIAVGASAGEFGDVVCKKCAKLRTAGSLGSCSNCPGQALSGAFKLCKTCSVRRGQCQRCLVRIAPPKAPPAKPMTDYSWSVASLTGKAVGQQGKLTYAPTRGPKAMDGSGGVYTATFKAIRKGKALLTMEYKKDAQPARTFTLTIVVGGRPAVAVSKKAAALAKLFKADIAKFTLDIRYFGPQDKPYYQLTLGTEKTKDRDSPFRPVARLTPNAARKIIDCLTADGYFDRAKDTAPMRMAMPKGPTYTLWVSGGKGCQLYESIGWDSKMLARLDALAGALDGDAGKNMTLLLDRLSGCRKKWREDDALANPKTKRKRNARLRGVTVD
jgi:predicted secreted protein